MDICVLLQIAPTHGDRLQDLINVSGNSNRGSVPTYRGGMEREMGGRFKTERS